MDVQELWEEHQQTIMIAGAVVIGVVMVGTFLWNAYSMLAGGSKKKKAKKKKEKPAGRGTPAGQSEQGPPDKEKAKEEETDAGLLQELQKLKDKGEEDDEAEPKQKQVEKEIKPEPKQTTVPDTYTERLEQLKARLELRKEEYQTKQNQMKSKLSSLRKELQAQRKSFQQKLKQRSKAIERRNKTINQTKQRVKELFSQIKTLKSQEDQKRSQQIRTASTYPAFKPSADRSLTEYDVHPSRPGTTFDGALPNGLRVLEGQDQHIMLSLDNGDRIRAVATPNAQSGRIDVEMDKENPGLYIDSETGKRYRIYGRVYSQYDQRAGLPAEVESSKFSGTLLAVLSGALGAGAQQYKAVQQAEQSASEEGGDAGAAGKSAAKKAGAQVASKAAQPFKQSLDKEARRRIMAPSTVITDGGQQVRIEVFPEPTRQLNQTGKQKQSPRRGGAGGSQRGGRGGGQGGPLGQ